MRRTSEQLRTETAQLVTALRAPQVRGRWGELQLERTVEAAGMTEHVDYVTQVSAPGDDGLLRPDLVVKLAGGKNIVVDSKVAFAGYLEAMEASDEATRDARLKAHAPPSARRTSTRWRRRRTGSGSPRRRSSSSASCRPTRSSTPRCARTRPCWSTPSRATSCWRRRPRWSPCCAPSPTPGGRRRWPPTPPRCTELGRELYQRLSTIGGHIDKLGRASAAPSASYNDACRSLESRVFVTARQMSDLGSSTRPRSSRHPARSPRSARDRPRRRSSPSSVWWPA